DLERTEQIASDDGARDAPEPADNGTDEGLEERREAHMRLDHARLGGPENARETRETRSDGESDDDQPVDVKADQVRGRHVLGGRAHAQPEVCPGDEPAER